MSAKQDPKKPAPKNPHGKAVARRTATIGDIADSMKQAESIWGIPIAVMRAAKNAGCPAFEKSRVHRKALLEWLETNPQIVAAGADAGSKAELEKEKLRVQIDTLKTRHAKETGILISRAKAESEWATCAAIVQEEAKLLMDRDHYRIWIDRIIARLSNVMPTPIFEPTTKKTKQRQENP